VNSVQYSTVQYLGDLHCAALRRAPLQEMNDAVADADVRSRTSSFQNTVILLHFSSNVSARRNGISFRPGEGSAVTPTKGAKPRAARKTTQNINILVVQDLQGPQASAALRSSPRLQYRTTGFKLPRYQIQLSIIPKPNLGQPFHHG
jgi:hypothetical protein